MKRTIRGHHLLCIHGFQGMGYSPDFVDKMREITVDFRNDQVDYPIEVTVGLDEACFSCPHKGDGFCNAGEGSDEHVKSMDSKVLLQLGLKNRGVYNKNDLVRLTAEKIWPEDLDELCKGCSWLSYGVCKNGIKQLKTKQGQ